MGKSRIKPSGDGEAKWTSNDSPKGCSDNRLDAVLASRFACPAVASHLNSGVPTTLLAIRSAQAAFGSPTSSLSEVCYGIPNFSLLASRRFFGHPLNTPDEYSTRRTTAP